MRVAPTGIVGISKVLPPFQLVIESLWPDEQSAKEGEDLLKDLEVPKK